MNSRAKGKRGELELARILRGYGYEARRGQQYSGANGDADVVGLPCLHIECKRRENLNLHNAMRQAVEDTKEGEIPVVMHRKNNEQWLATVELDTFLMMYELSKDLLPGAEWLPITITEGQTHFVCSHCSLLVTEKLKYCPNCGTPMDKRGQL